MGGNSPYEYSAILKSIIKPIIKNTNERNKVVMVFYINDNVPNIIEKEKLLDSTSSIIESLYGNDVYPKEKYTRNITEFIRNNYPQSIKDITLEINKPIKKSLQDSPFYRNITLYPIRFSVGLVNKLRSSYLTEISNKTSTKKEL